MTPTDGKGLTISQNNYQNKFQRGHAFRNDCTKLSFFIILEL
jgi:hypothetical protein